MLRNYLCHNILRFPNHARCVSSAVSSQLREVLRHAGQPVSVVTCLASQGTHPTKFHGATLSSFASVAMDPLPVVSFALRLPSRMSTFLRDSQAQSQLESHMVINFLSASQATMATQFSHPSPFSDPVSYKLSKDGLPILDGVIGAISCRVMSIVPLYPPQSPDIAADTSSRLSELVLAKVLRVDVCSDEKSDHPLIYHRRCYTTVV